MLNADVAEYRCSHSTEWMHQIHGVRAGVRVWVRVRSGPQGEETDGCHSQVHEGLDSSSARVRSKAIRIGLGLGLGLVRVRY